MTQPATSALRPYQYEALLTLDDHIARQDQTRWRLASHQAAWRRRPPTKPQQQLIRKLGLTLPATSGEASQLINQLDIQRQAELTSGRPTTNQRWFLKRHNAWREDLTFVEAYLTIRTIKQQMAAAQDGRNRLEPAAS